MSETEHTKNFITLKTISELLGNKYFIPAYQRGYRWQPQQVKDLLNDINEFDPSKENEFYCLQPLVVQGIFSKNIENLNIDDVKKALRDTCDKSRLWEEFKKILDVKYEVVDGQQRLTTIKIILNYLNAESFDVEYATRDGSKQFLNAISDSKKRESESLENIDYFYMAQAYKTVNDWFEGKDATFKEGFKEKLLNKTRVIWYETAEENIIGVFERLNSGKIPLTNAELIKALFLKSSNFGEVNPNELRLYQQEIAMQWDEIEYALQNDEFWLFLNKTVEAGKIYNDTRIDFIFDLICEKNLFEVGKDDIGDDNLKAYRYINKKFENNITKKEIEELWKKVRDIYLTLKEWYNDIELYHYIGFLLIKGYSILDIYEYKVAAGTKQDFIKKIKNEIIEYLKTLYKSDLDKLLKLDFNKDKDKCRNVLLLHNLLTIVNILKNQKNSKYKLSAFYKFPFHLYKKEKFDIEHIASQTPNDMSMPEKPWEGDNSLRNLALLDYKTNRGYGNAIFSVKRNWIISKEVGNEDSIAFVPQCTKNAFQKFYTKNAGNLLEWSEDDANEYFNNMKETLEKFIKSK